MQRGLIRNIGWLMVVLWMSFPSLGQAAAESCLYLNGNAIPLPTALVMKNHVTFIPLRVISEQLGYNVDWNEEAKTVKIHNDHHSLKLTIEQKVAIVNDKAVTVDWSPIVKQHTTLVPLRFVGENMGLTVKWEKDTNSVHLFTVEQPPPDVVLPPAGTPPPPEVRTQDVHITDCSFVNNQLQITSNSHVKPQIMTLTNPDRVVVDLPGAVFSDTFYKKFNFKSNGQGEIVITDDTQVQRIRFALFQSAPSIIRFVIDTNHALQGEVATNDQGLTTITLVAGTNSGELSPRTDGTYSVAIDTGNGVHDSGISSILGQVVGTNSGELSSRTDGTYTVVIDAGHGGRDPGGSSIWGRKEKEVNLAISLKVGQLLRQDDRFHVQLTREEDIFLGLGERVQLANTAAADLFVSIHANSVAGKPTVNGTETYFWRSDSKAFANKMHAHLLEGTQLADRGVREGDLHVIRETIMPAILLEIGYLTNETDEALLFEEQFQMRVAEFIVKGIQDYLGLL